MSGPDLEAATVSAVHQDQGEAVVLGEVSDAEILPVAAKIGVGDGLLVQGLQKARPNFEEAPVPVNLVTVDGRRAAAKVRAFVDFMTPRLRCALRNLPGSAGIA